VAYAVLSASSRFATPKTNVETGLALFLSLTARCVPVAPPGALGSVDEAIARSLALPESTSRRTQLRSLQRSNGGPGGAGKSITMLPRKAKGRRNDGAVITATWDCELHRRLTQDRRQAGKFSRGGNSVAEAQPNRIIADQRRSLSPETVRRGEERDRCAIVLLGGSNPETTRIVRRVSRKHFAVLHRGPDQHFRHKEASARQLCP